MNPAHSPLQRSLRRAPVLFAAAVLFASLVHACGGNGFLGIEYPLGGPGGATPSASGTPSGTPTFTPTRPLDSPTPTATLPAEENLRVCSQRGNSTQPFTDQVTCWDETDRFEWDVFTFDVRRGDCIHIRADNSPTGAADLLAFAQDASGAYYGLADDFSQLEDEWQCSTLPWDGFGCPDRSVTAGRSGPFVVAVAQWGGGCTLSDYTVWIAVNGRDLDLRGPGVTVQQDVELF